MTTQRLPAELRETLTLPTRSCCPSYAGPVRVKVTRCFNVYGFVAATPTSKKFSAHRYTCG